MDAIGKLPTAGHGGYMSAGHECCQAQAGPDTRARLGGFEYRLAKWALNKYASFKGSYSEAFIWIKDLKRSYPGMFYYWTLFKHV